VFADAPVVVKDRMQGSAGAPVALGDTDLLFTPLSPTIAGALTTGRLQDMSLAPHGVQELNTVSWHWARRFVGMSRDFDRERAFGWATGTIRHFGRA
jgi:hypothetical protein